MGSGKEATITHFSSCNFETLGIACGWLRLKSYMYMYMYHVPTDRSLLSHGSIPSLVSHGFLSPPCILSPSLSLLFHNIAASPTPIGLVWYVDTLPWICSQPPVELFSAAQAMGQPSSLLGIRPRLTRSAKLFSLSYRSKNFETIIISWKLMWIVRHLHPSINKLKLHLGH